MEDKGQLARFVIHIHSLGPSLGHESLELFRGFIKITLPFEEGRVCVFSVVFCSK